jgi:alkylated DNA repair dioxygenase AlkB
MYWLKRATPKRATPKRATPKRATPKRATEAAKVDSPIVNTQQVALLGGAGLRARRSWREPKFCVMPSDHESTWTSVVEDRERECRSRHMLRALPEQSCRYFLQVVHDGTTWMQPQGRHGPMPRFTAWLVAPGCSCTYRYGGTEVNPQVFPSWMPELMKQVMPLCGLRDEDSWPNSCNLNLYTDGNHAVGWHSDDEPLFGAGSEQSTIISMSLGEGRRFQIRDSRNPGTRKVTEVFLGDGDLLTMEGFFQRHFQHRIPQESSCKALRINLTWRWLRSHRPECGAKICNGGPSRTPMSTSSAAASGRFVSAGPELVSPVSRWRIKAVTGNPPKEPEKFISLRDSADPV